MKEKEEEMIRKAIIRLGGLFFISSSLLATTITKTFTFNTGDLGWESVTYDGITYDYPVVEGCDARTEIIGAPSMPAKDAYFLIPFYDDIVGVKVTSSSSTSTSEARNVVPCLPPTVDDSVVHIIDPNYYYGKYPRLVAEVIGQDWSADHNIAHIRVYPIDHNPSDSTTTFYTSISIELILEDGNGPDYYPVRKDTIGGFFGTDQYISLAVQNPDDMYSLPDNPSQVTTSNEIQYLIICCREELCGEFQRLADWRTRMGIRAKVVTLPDAISGQTGRDTQEKLRKYLQGILGTTGYSLRYVLLVGDSVDLPPRSSFPKYMSRGDPKLTTDFYYSDLDLGDWDDDNDGIYGEKAVSPTTHLSFISSTTGYAYGGTCYKGTYNGSQWTWTAKGGMRDVSDVNVRDLKFVNDGGTIKGWATVDVDWGVGAIWLGTNDGQDWQKQHQFDEFAVTALEAIDSRLWVAHSSEMKIEYSTSSGSSWTTQTLTSSSGSINNIDIVKDGSNYKGWSVGNYVYNTTNGTNWNSITMPSGCSGVIWNVVYIDPDNHNTAWLIGRKSNAQKIIHTHDFGATWHGEVTYTDKYLDGICFKGNTGWAVGSNGNLFQSVDGGHSWTEITGKGSTAYKDIWLTDDASGGDGIVSTSSDNLARMFHAENGLSNLAVLPNYFGGDDPSFNYAAQADVSVGRAPVSTVSEARVFVNKVLDYELNPPSSGFCNELVCFSTDGSSCKPNYIGYDEMYDTRKFVSCQSPYNWSNSDLSYFSKKNAFYYHDEAREGGHPSDLPTSNPALNYSIAISEINSNYNIIWHADHGMPNGVYVDPAHKALTIQEAREFHNIPSIFMTTSCASNFFSRPDDDCFAEAMIKNPGGGAVAYIGSTVQAWTGYAVPRRFKMMEALFNPTIANSLPFRTLGEIFSFSFAQDREYHLLGDPAMVVWTANPKTPALSVSHPTQITKSGQNITITVTAGGTGVQNAIVCLYKPEATGHELYNVQKVVNSNGTITFSVSPYSEGPMFITVTRQNYKPYTGVCWVGSTTNTLSTGGGYTFQRQSLGSYNARNIAVDDNSNLHLACYVTDGTGDRPYYFFSNNGGSTWGRLLVENVACKNTALALGRGGRPFVVYKPYNSTNLYVKDMWTGVKQLLISGQLVSNTNCEAAFAIDQATNIGYIGVYNTKDRIFVCKFDLDNIENNAKWPPTSSSITSGVGTDSRPSVTILGNGDALYAYSAGTNLYVCRPFDNYKTPINICPGSNPSVRCEGDLILLTYRTTSSNLATKYGSFKNNFITWTSPENLPGSSTGNLPQSSGINVNVWNNAGVPNSVKTSGRNASGWTTNELSPNGKSILGAYYPQSDVNYRNAKIAVAWTEEYTSSGTKDSIALKLSDLDDYPGSSGYWAEIDLTSPSSKGKYQLYKPLPTVKWTLTSSGTGNKTVLTFGVNGASSAETYIIDTVSSSWAGIYPYPWVAGEYGYYKNDGKHYRIPAPQFPGPEYTNCYFKAKLINSSGQIIASDVEGPFAMYCNSWPGTADPYAPNNNILSIPSHQEPNDSIAIGWGLQSCTGFSSVSLEYSTDNGESWHSTSSICTTPDSAVIDTFEVEVDSVTTDTLYTLEYTDTTRWQIPNEPTSSCFLRLIFEDSTSRKDTLTADSSFVISLPGGNANSTKFNQRMIGLGTETGAIGMVYHGPANEIYYTQSNKGWKLDEADSIATGLYPLQGAGSVFWMSNTVSASAKDTIRSSHWDAVNSTFTAPTDIICNGGAYVYTSKYSLPDVILIGDSNHVVTLNKSLIFYNSQYKTYFSLIHTKFHKDNPGNRIKDSTCLNPGGFTGADTFSTNAISAAIKGSYLYMALTYRDTNYYWKTPLGSPSIAGIKKIGKGSCPNIALSDHDIIYSYVSADSGSIIRLWDYIEDTDTSWTDKDTFPLGYDASCMSASEGLLYGVQQSDSILSHQYIFDPLTEQLIKEETYEGYYSHPYVDTDSSFNRVTCYTWKYDSGGYCFKTDRTFLNGIYPALVIKPASIISPYTKYRNSYIFTDSVPADSSLDSVKYACSLDTAKLYGLAVEFYSNADTVTKLEITVNNDVDTVDIPGSGEFSAYDANIPASADSCKIRIRRISAEGYVSVSHVVVRYRTEADMYTMGKAGPGLKGAEKITFCLYQPFPNPFTDAAMIRYAVPYATSVSLKVYDISGRLVNKLEEGKVDAGVHTIRWSGKDQLNRKCASGIYFVRFVASGYVASKKMVMIK